MADVEVRRLGAEAVAAVLAVWKEAGLPCRPRGRDHPRELARRIDEGTDVFLGAYSEGNLVGTVLVTHDGRKGWINRLAVVPPFQRMGVAALLVAEAEEFLRSRGVRIFAALVEEDNAVSLSFFRRAGYVLHRDIFYLSKRDDPEV